MVLLDKACAEMYKTAFEKCADQSNQEELAALWFASCVRLGDPTQQQQVALTMHKRFKKPKYFFWAITSCAQQVYFSKYF